MQAIAVTTRIGCKVACSYCPQSKLIKNYLKRSKITQMSFETFKKCIDKIPRKVKIIFSGFSEPFLNPDCSKMIKYGDSQNFKIKIFTTTVGITKADIDILKKINIRRFVIHLPDDKQFTGIEPNENYFKIMDEIIKNIPNVVFLFVKGPHSSENVHPKVKKYLKEKKKVILYTMMSSRSENVKIDGFSVKRINEPLSGCMRMKVNILLPNGDVVLCCNDYSQKHILGNLLSSDYESLFKSDEYIKVLKGLKDDSLDILCRYCFLYVRRSNLLLRYLELVQYKLIPLIKMNVKK